MIPSGFAKICTESQVGLALIVVMCIVAAGGVGVSVWNWNVERGIERLRGEREVMSLASGSRGVSSDGNGKEAAGKVLEMPTFIEKGDLERGSRRY